MSYAQMQHHPPANPPNRRNTYLLVCAVVAMVRTKLKAWTRNKWRWWWCFRSFSNHHLCELSCCFLWRCHRRFVVAVVRLLQWSMWSSNLHLLLPSLFDHRWHHLLLSCLVRVFFVVLLLLRLPSVFCMLFDVLLFSNGALGTHGRNIAPSGIICRGTTGVSAFWVCRKWSNREWWG